MFTHSAPFRSSFISLVADAVTTCEAEVESLESEVSKVDFQLKQLSSGSGSSSSSSSSSSGDVEMDSGAGAGSKRGKGKKDTAGAGAGSSVTIADADRGEYNQLKATERQKTADQREQLERLQLQQDGDESERAKQRGNFDAAKSRLEQLEQQTSQQKERRDGLAKALLDSQAALKVKQEELAAHRKELEIAVKRQEQLGGELEAVKVGGASRLVCYALYCASAVCACSAIFSPRRSYSCSSIVETTPTHAAGRAVPVQHGQVQVGHREAHGGGVRGHEAPVQRREG